MNFWDDEDLEEFTEVNEPDLTDTKSKARLKRINKRKHFKRRKELSELGGYNPCIGWEINGYMHYPKNSKAQKYLKKLSNRKVRSNWNIKNYGGYKKCFDYWWNLY